MHRLLWHILVALLAVQIHCDVQIQVPEPGSSYDLSKGSASLNIEWLVTEDEFSEEDIETYIFTLVSGPNSGIEAMYSLGTFAAHEITDLDLTFIVPNTVGTDGKYYIQVMALSDAGFTIHYSNRFSFSGMAGEKKASGNDKVPPNPETRITTADLPIEINSASFSITYSLQTGKARFAPMQQQPPTKMTATAWKMRHATSAVTYYSTIRRSLDQMTTITPGLSYALAADANYATPAPMPSENGMWYNPKKRQSLTARKKNQ